MHVHVVPGHDQDHRHQRAQGDRLRLPVPGRLEGRRRDRRADPRPGHLDPAPGHGRPCRVRRAGHQGREHRPAEGQGHAVQGRLQAGRVRDQVPVRLRRPAVRRGQGRDRQGPQGRWLQGDADRVDQRDHPHRPHRLRLADQRPLQRLVLGLADRWLLVPGPVGR